MMIRIDQLNRVCGDAYKAHYECLDNHNQQYKDCRPAERGFNACVQKRMVSILVIQVDDLGIIESCSWDSKGSGSIISGTESILWT